MKKFFAGFAVALLVATCSAAIVTSYGLPGDVPPRSRWHESTRSR